MAGPIGSVTSGVQLSVNQYKSSFFDRTGLEVAVADGLFQAKRKFGAYLRTRMRSAIRKRNRVSRPGESPTNQTGTLKGFIYFAYEDKRGAVVVGPAKTNQKNAQGYAGKTIPQTLEQGGLVRLFEHQVPNIPDLYHERAGTWVRSDFRFKHEGPTRSPVGRPRRIRWAKIEARPFVKVSATAELASGKHSELLRGIVRK